MDSSSGERYIYLAKMALKRGELQKALKYAEMGPKSGEMVHIL